MKLTEEIKEYWANNRESSHWRGVGKWADDKAWRGMGERNVQRCAVFGNSRSVIEWGVGGGANALAFKVDDYYGVDISAETLRECAKQANIHPVLIDIDHPEVDLPHVDLFISTAVFQHFPSREYGIHILKIAHELTDAAMIQIRYGKPTRSRFGRYASQASSFTTYGLEEFCDIVIKVGFKPLEVIVYPQTKYAYYLLRK